MFIREQKNHFYFIIRNKTKRKGFPKCLRSEVSLVYSDGTILVFLLVSLVVLILITQDILDHFAEFFRYYNFLNSVVSFSSDFNSSISVQTFLASGERFFWTRRVDSLPVFIFMLISLICSCHMSHNELFPVQRTILGIFISQITHPFKLRAD